MKTKQENISDIIKANPLLYPNLNNPANNSDVKKAIECAGTINLTDNLLNDFLGFVELTLKKQEGNYTWEKANQEIGDYFFVHQNIAKFLSSAYVEFSEEGNDRLNAFGTNLYAVMNDFHTMFVQKNRPADNYGIEQNFAQMNLVGAEGNFYQAPKKNHPNLENVVGNSGLTFTNYQKIILNDILNGNNSKPNLDKLGNDLINNGADIEKTFQFIAQFQPQQAQKPQAVQNNQNQFGNFVQDDAQNQLKKKIKDLMTQSNLNWGDGVAENYLESVLRNNKHHIDNLHENLFKLNPGNARQVADFCNFLKSGNNGSFVQSKLPEEYQQKNMNQSYLDQFLKGDLKTPTVKTNGSQSAIQGKFTKAAGRAKDLGLVLSENELNQMKNLLEGGPYEPNVKAYHLNNLFGGFMKNAHEPEFDLILKLNDYISELLG